MLADALREAAAAGVRVVAIELGRWQGRPLLAEFDPAAKIIGIDRKVVERLRAAGDGEFANRFVAFAIWHELYHVRYSTRDERAAHEYASARTGVAAALFENVVREFQR